MWSAIPAGTEVAAAMVAGATGGARRRGRRGADVVAEPGGAGGGDVDGREVRRGAEHARPPGLGELVADGDVDEVTAPGRAHPRRGGVPGAAAGGRRRPALA